MSNVVSLYRNVACASCGETKPDRWASDGEDLCFPCAAVAHRVRAAIESRGGSLVVVDGRFVVRTAVERRDPAVLLEERDDVRRALAASPLL